MTLIIQPGDGEKFDSMGDSMAFKLMGSDTDGQYTLIEDTLKPGFKAGLHLHRYHSETFYILEGAVTFEIGSQTLVATPGTTVHVTPNVPHAAYSDQAGKMLTLFSPSGLENALRAFRQMTPAQAHDPAFVQQIMDENDLVDLSPFLTTLIRFYDHLLAGNVDHLCGIFSGEPRIDTPLQGEVQGSESFVAFVQAQQAWLQAQQAQPTLVNLIETPERVVVEYLLHLEKEGETIDLPVTVVFEGAGEQVSGIRVYHSTWPLTGGHVLRQPLLAPADHLVEPAIVEAYMHALTAGDKAAIMATFAEAGYVREPSGAQYKHSGAAGRSAFYDMALAHGGVRLHHCTATQRARSFAVEYICDQWGQTALPPQAGMAVYEWDTTGKLVGVRIYDDVTPPGE